VSEFRSGISYSGRVKHKAAPLYTMEEQGERMYSSYSVLVSTVDGGQWLRSRTPRPRFTPGERTPAPIVYEAG
jgi:hypothetical protein